MSVTVAERVKLSCDTDLSISAIRYALEMAGMPEVVELHVHPYAKRFAEHLLFETFNHPYEYRGRWVFEHTKVVIHPEWSEDDEGRWELVGLYKIVWSPGV